MKCSLCLKTFRPKRATAAYCSATCRNRAYRNKLALQENELALQSPEPKSPVMWVCAKCGTDLGTDFLAIPLCKCRETDFNVLTSRQTDSLTHLTHLTQADSGVENSVSQPSQLSQRVSEAKSREISESVSESVESGDDHV